MAIKTIQPAGNNRFSEKATCGGTLATIAAASLAMLTLSAVAADRPSAKGPTAKAPAAQIKPVSSISSHANGAKHAKGSGLMKVTEIEGISEYRMKNGVRVLLFPDNSKEVVTVNMTVFVGSRHEGYGEAGMAHLLEHMLFKGTPSHPHVPKVLSDRGARFNGTTSTDRTNYYETLAASDDNLEFAIRLEADRLVNSNILGTDLESEMTVVRNEFERGENSPIGVLVQRIQAAAYEWHNYGRTTIGNRSDIERVPILKLRDFYRKYYRPDNVMVIVAGKFDSEKAIHYLDTYFGALPSPETPLDGTYTVEPPQDGERTVVLRRVGEVQFAGIAYHVPSSSHPDFAAMKSLVYVFGDEPSGRLYRKLVKGEIATNVHAFTTAYNEPGLFMSIAEVPLSASIEKARSTLIAVIEQSLADEPITEEEVERAKQNILKQRELEAADSDRIAVSLSNWAAQGDWRLYFLYRDSIEKLTRDEVQKAAEKYFVRNNRTVGLFIPSDKAQKVAIPESPDLVALLDGYKGREAVAAGEQFDPSPLAIEARTERGKLLGSVRYALLPKKTRGGTVSLRVAVRFGTDETLRDKVGAAELLGMLMSRGTDKMDYQQIQDELTRLRADLSMNSTVGLLDTRIKTKREFLPEVIALLGELLRRPRLDSSELEVIRPQVVTSLQQNLADPQALAPRLVRKKLAPYSEDDIRYVKSIDEEIKMYEQVTIEELRELHADFLGNQTVEVSVVGDFDADEVKALLASQLKDWQTNEPYVRVGRDPHPEIVGSTELIETPDKQNALLFGQLQHELRDDDPVYASLVLGNFILGGGSLSSRLADRVRQSEGLSYTVRSIVTARAKDNRVDFTLYAITNPRNKDRLLEVMLEEIDRLRKDGVTEEELKNAKNSYLQAARVRRTGDGSLASELLGTLFIGRTMQYHADHEKQIESATVESVNQAIRDYIVPEKLVTAIAGDFAAQ